MRRSRLVFAFALAAATGCQSDLSSPIRGVTGGPRLTVGPTTHVVVSCPANLVDGQSGQCSAAGYDASDQFTGSTATWSTPTSSVNSVSSSGVATALHLAQGTALVDATIEGVQGEASISVSLSDLAVSVSGNSPVKPNTDCVWWASVSGGNASYSYAWSRSGSSQTSTASEFTTQSASSFTIYLTVTDALGTWRSTSRAISISSTAGICPT